MNDGLKNRWILYKIGLVSNIPVPARTSMTIPLSSDSSLGTIYKYQKYDCICIPNIRSILFSNRFTFNISSSLSN